ncbi:hypothetical protein FKM82_006486 [Ascaphus truei]
MESLIASNTTFALDLYKKLTEGNADQNIFFSPWSISSALTMVYLGARGNTESQMAQNPGAGKSDNIHPVFQKLLSRVNQPMSAYQLKTANTLYSEKSLNVVKEYMQLIQKYYHAEVQAVDFVAAADDARKKINSWVEGQTEGKIKDLLPPGSVDSVTRLVLVNAIYFKGSWENKFPEENTEEKPFRMSKLEKEMSVKKLKEWTSADMMEKTKVVVDLPRILLEESYDLKGSLSSMGLSDLFNAEIADLKGISAKSKLYLSQVFHKSFVEINEEGTEAAAATAGIAAVRSALFNVTFEADHPFLFFIRHNKTNSILFYGKFCSP